MATHQRGGSVRNVEAHPPDLAVDPLGRLLNGVLALQACGMRIVGLIVLLVLPLIALVADDLRLADRCLDAGGTYRYTAGTCEGNRFEVPSSSLKTGGRYWIAAGLGAALAGVGWAIDQRIRRRSSSESVGATSSSDRGSYR